MDALELTRDLDAFARRYRYDLCGQLFLERPSEEEEEQGGGGVAGGGRHLNTVGVAQVDSAVRVHGTGIVNTAVRRGGGVDKTDDFEDLQFPKF